MKVYQIRVPLKGDAVFEVEAESEQEARAAHLAGESTFLDDEVSYVEPPFSPDTTFTVTPYYEQVWACCTSKIGPTCQHKKEATK